MQYILLVEDDEDLAEGIALALEGEGLSFTRCRSAKEAREALEKQNYDLLLFDISLPDGSGLELCRKVRQTSRVPIALLTAKDMELDIVKGLEGGADDYITKPFSLMVLRARIRALLRRTAGGPEEVYQKSSLLLSLWHHGIFQKRPGSGTGKDGTADSASAGFQSGTAPDKGAAPGMGVA